MKKFIVVMCQREDWDEPTVKYIEAKDESGARDKFAIECGYEEDPEVLEEGEEEGDICIIIKEIGE